MDSRRNLLYRKKEVHRIQEIEKEDLISEVRRNCTSGSDSCIQRENWWNFAVVCAPLMPNVGKPRKRKQMIKQNKGLCQGRYTASCSGHETPTSEREIQMRKNMQLKPILIQSELIRSQCCKGFMVKATGDGKI